MNRAFHFTALVTALLCTSLAGHADELQMPRVRSSGGIPYISGGIGADERQAMQTLASEYNLRLTFSQAGSGSLLADIKVGVIDSSGSKRLEVVSEGPLLFIRLPPGRYRLEAMHTGNRLEKNVTLPPKGSRTLALQWPPEDKRAKH